MFSTKRHGAPRFYRKPVRVKSDSELYELYKLSSKQAAEKWQKKLGQYIEPDDYLLG